MKTVIVYESTHHGNTFKLVQAIKQKYEVDVVNVQECTEKELTAYDLIAFASGIAFGKFYEKIRRFSEENLPKGKKVVFIYTCGRDSGKYLDSMRRLADDRECEVLGAYSCKGFDTYGPFKLIGGTNKHHPNEAEITGAVEFWGKIVEAK